MKIYDPTNHYWIVAGSTTQVYSSKAVAYVPVANAAYVAWKADPAHRPTRIATEQDLIDALIAVGMPVPAGKVASDTSKTTQINGVNKVVFKILFNHENRIRTLAGQPAVTQAQFITAVKALL